VNVISSSTAPGAAQAHVRSKEHLLTLLSSRVVDKAALVRQRALQTWADLLEEQCVPLPWYNLVLGLGKQVCLKAGGSCWSPEVPLCITLLSRVVGGA
jgi:hypothetical protein